MRDLRESVGGSPFRLIHGARSSSVTSRDARRCEAEQWLLEHCGTTDDVFLAGWMLRDGTMIGMDRGEGRLAHHTMAREAFAVRGLEEQVRLGRRSVRDPVRLALEAGWVRIMVGTDLDLAFEFSRPLTLSQQARILATTEVAVSVAVDVVDPADSRHSLYWSGDLPTSHLQVRQAVRAAERAAEGFSLGVAEGSVALGAA